MAQKPVDLLLHLDAAVASDRPDYFYYFNEVLDGTLAAQLPASDGHRVAAVCCSHSSEDLVLPSKRGVWAFHQDFPRSFTEATSRVRRIQGVQPAAPHATVAFLLGCLAASAQAASADTRQLVDGGRAVHRAQAPLVILDGRALDAQFVANPDACCVARCQLREAAATCELAGAAGLERSCKSLQVTVAVACWTLAEAKRACGPVRTFCDDLIGSVSDAPEVESLVEVEVLPIGLAEDAVNESIGGEGDVPGLRAQLERLVVGILARCGSAATRVKSTALVYLGPPTPLASLEAVAHVRQDAACVAELARLRAGGRAKAEKIHVVLDIVEAGLKSIEAEDRCSDYRGCGAWNVHVFGSLASGFCSDASDLDLVVDTGSRVNVKSFLGTLMEAISFTAGQDVVSDVSHILTARTPIVSFTVWTVRDFVSIDISCDNLMPLRNSRLLRRYSRLHPRVYDIVLLVKGLFSRLSMLGARFGYLSSYALTICVVHFLQRQWRLPVLPVYDDSQDAAALPSAAAEWLNAAPPELLVAQFAYFFGNLDNSTGCAIHLTAAEADAMAAPPPVRNTSVGHARILDPFECIHGGIPRDLMASSNNMNMCMRRIRTAAELLSPAKLWCATNEEVPW